MDLSIFGHICLYLSCREVAEGYVHAIYFKGIRLTFNQVVRGSNPLWLKKENTLKVFKI